MPTPYTIERNLAIPGKMTALELGYLGRLASTVPAGGVIVEVGPLFGRSTFAIASAAPLAKVFSIDVWKTAPWIEKYRAKTPDAPPFGVDAFKAFLADCPNVTPIKGFSPDVVEDWTAPVDLYFEDAIHGNPGLKANLDFWISRLKPGGVLCGHDYSLRFPDVKREADAIAKAWGTSIEVVGSIWAVRRPKPDDKPGVSISTLVPALSGPSLRLVTRNRRRDAATHEPLTWGGALLEPDPLSWFSMHWTRRIDDLDVEYRVGHPEFGESEWVRSGQKCFLDHDGKRRPIWRVAARLLGPLAENYTVACVGSFRQIGHGGHLVSGVGLPGSDGAWAEAVRPGAPMTALSVRLQPKSAAISEPEVEEED